MKLDRKIQQRLAALDAEVAAFKTTVDEGVALLSDPTDPPKPQTQADFLAMLDAQEEPFRRAARALEIELRRAGLLVSHPTRGTDPANRRQHKARRTMRAWQPLRDGIALAFSGAEPGVTPSWMAGMVATQADALARTIVLVDRILNSTEQDDAMEALGAYRDIPMQPDYFMAMMHGAWRIKAAEGQTEGLRFLDVGSGRGTTLLMAARFFPTVHGIELDPGYHEHACRLLEGGHTPGCTPILANALSFDDYGDYDIIYFYKPLSDIDRLVEMEARIVAQAKPGALLIAPYFGFEDRHAPKDINKVEWHIYQRNGAGADGAALAQAVRRIGPFVLYPGNTISSKVCGYWAPLVKALAGCGYRPSSLE